MGLQTLRYSLTPADFNPESDEPQDFSEGFIARVTLPEGAQLLPTVELSTKGLLVYVIADPDSPEGDEREFFVVGNGKDLPEHQLPDAASATMSYRGTAKIPSGPTFHVFELVKAAV